VLRHLVAHPEDAPSQLARHTGLHADTASKTLKRLREQGIHDPEQALDRLRQTSRRPARRSVHFQAPNPLQWLRQYPGPFLVSGQIAAAEVDGYDLVPGSLLVYVPGGDVDAAIRAATDVFAVVTAAREANLHLRVADPWLAADDTRPHAVERGQRLLDYEEDPLISLARRLTPSG